jgi:hypothetical protein
MSARFFISPIDAIESKEQVLQNIQKVIPEVDRILLANDKGKYMGYGFLHCSENPGQRITSFEVNGMKFVLDEWQLVKRRDSQHEVGVVWD